MRRNTLIRYEVHALSSGGFEFVVIDESGHEITETFQDEKTLLERQIEFELHLRNEGWTGPRLNA